MNYYYRSQWVAGRGRGWGGQAVGPDNDQDSPVLDAVIFRAPSNY